MVELVFDTDGRDVVLERIAVRPPEKDPVRLEFSKSDGLPVKPCAGGHEIFTFDGFRRNGLKLCDRDAADLFRTAAACDGLYVDAVVAGTGEHAPEMALVAVNELTERYGERTVLVDLTRSPLKVRPVTARMSVCLSDADEVRTRMRGVIKSALLDRQCDKLVSAESVAGFLTGILMENGAWMDVAYPSLDRSGHAHDFPPYALERYSKPCGIGFFLTRTPCSVKTLVDGILADGSCPKGDVTVETCSGTNISLSYDAGRIVKTSGPLGRVEYAFVDQDRVSVREDGTGTHWAVKLP